MAQLIIRADNFNLTSTQVCCTQETWSTDDSEAPLDYVDTSYSISQSPNTATHDVTFEFASLEGCDITSAKVYATSGSPLYGADACTINGVSVGYATTNAVEVSIESGALSVVCPFAFRASPVTHAHEDLDNASWYDEGHSSTRNFYLYRYYFQHQSVLQYSDVYLLIEYTPAYTPPELIPYTDPAPVALETYVKAVHMTELHENVNRVRAAYGLEAYAFTAITAMETLLAGWNAHAEEIRAALDEIGIEHGEWLALGVNCPRLDVLLQLRSMVRVVAGVEEETDDGSGGAGEDTGGDDSGDEIDENAWMDVTITSVEQTGDGEVTITWEATVDTGVYIPYEVIGDAYAQKPTVYGALTTTITGVSAGVHSYSIMPVDQSLGYNRYGNKSAAVSVTVE